MKECFGVYIGKNSDCFWDDRDDWAVVHACKYPCHRNALGYRNSLPSNHPNYLIYRRNSHLALNLVDMDQLDDRFMRPIIIAFYEFMDDMEGQKVLIHCNQGESRAPSLAILYLAKRKGIIQSQSFDTARECFTQEYPYYNPGLGFRRYLKNYWDSL